MCDKIIAARKLKGDTGFDSVNELRSIKGVGDKTYAKLKEKVTI